MSDQLPQEEHLLQKIKTGDKLAFRRLFDRFYQLLLTLAISLLKDVDTAKDVVQEVFFQIWKKRETLTVPNNTEAYLKRSVINRSYNHIKANRRMTNIADQPEMVSPTADGQAVVEAAELEQVIQAALARLPDRCREVFVLKRMEGRSLKEIGELLNISPKTAENQMTKALKSLKEALKPYLE